MITTELGDMTWWQLMHELLSGLWRIGNNEQGTLSVYIDIQTYVIYDDYQNSKYLM